jgi:hypothetical protein
MEGQSVGFAASFRQTSIVNAVGSAQLGTGTQAGRYNAVYQFLTRQGRFAGRESKGESV